MLLLLKIKEYIYLLACDQLFEAKEFICTPSRLGNGGRPRFPPRRPPRPPAPLGNVAELITLSVL